MPDTHYPWYTGVTGDEIEQGDILENCPIFMPSDTVSPTDQAEAVFNWEMRDVILLSPSSDLVKGHERSTEVLLAAAWKASEIKEGYLATMRGLEEARRGNLPAFHVLAASTIPGYEAEARVVDFRRISTVSIGFFRKRAALGPRLRLLPPYREHMAHAFARFISRPSLPVEITPFR